MQHEEQDIIGEIEGRNLSDLSRRAKMAYTTLHRIKTGETQNIRKGTLQRLRRAMRAQDKQAKK